MIALSLQIALFILLVEACLWCLPKGVRRASRANCLRPDGTRSTTRTRIERTAYHYLRLEVAAPLLLIFLLGNAVYQTIDKTLAPVPVLVNEIAQRIGLASAADQSPEGITSGVWARVIAFTLAWLAFSFVVVGWRLIGAWRKFAEGVRTRSSEYFQFDVTRKSKRDRTTSSSPLTSVSGSHDSPS